MEDKREIIALLHQSGIISKAKVDEELANLCMEPIAPDGSTRKFFRIRRDGFSLCLAVAPASQDKQDLKEARAVWKIGKHLEQKKLPVPRMYGKNFEIGLILCEDMGDTKLFDLVTKKRKPGNPLPEEVKAYYQEVITILADMQVEGVKDFDTSWCWDTKRYDEDLRFSREGMYFLSSFWRDMLGCDISKDIIAECREIAKLAHDGDDFFLHRDFQSRNIMIKDSKVGIIDFQGGRLGPLGYDLASLLIDPYAALSEKEQDELFHKYLEIIRTRHEIQELSFHRAYSFLALQRNLQILGAFAFLFRVRKKAFFQQYIRPSVSLLQKRLSDDHFSHFSSLRQCVDKAVDLVK